MNEVGTLNINGCDTTNKDVTVTYVPKTFVTSYQYTIYKDDLVYNTVTVSNNKESNVYLKDTGNYKIKIVAYTTEGYITYTTNEYKIDKESPVITVDNESVTIAVGEHYDIYSNVEITDNIDGDITNKVTTNINTIDFNSWGKKKLTYEVVDQAGNKAAKDITINVSYDNYLLNVNQVLVIGILVTILIFLLILDRVVRLEKRIVKYTVSPLKDQSKSIFDKIAIKINNLSYRISNYIDRFESIQKLSKRYQNYVDAFSDGSYNGIDFISKKIIVSFTLLIVSIIIQTLRFKLLGVYELIIPAVLGYYLLDIIYAYKYHKYRKRIEKDLLQAIIIMNNCFKSGRSISQAVDLVSEQMEGAIALEFKKMSLEISFGLDMEEVFKRFADRIKIEEATYLTSSISVLNKTGGNIIKVFTSIEKTLFNRQKLNLEMKSMTASSKVIMNVLTIMPILFVILISFIKPDYFVPLFSNQIGFIILGIILVLYVCYILVVRKIMKVRM